MRPRRPFPARRSARAPLSALVTGLVLLGGTGCGALGSSSGEAAKDPTPTMAALPSGDPTEGIEGRGKGYTLTAPPGWAVTTDQVKQRYAQVDASAGDTAVTGGFADNVNVIVSDK